MNGLTTAPFVFHRLFGDSTGEELPVVGNQHVAVVAVDDNFSFRSAFNSLPNYKAYFDFDGDGAIGVADNFQFRSRFNRPLIWSVRSSSFGKACGRRDAGQEGNAIGVRFGAINATSYTVDSATKILASANSG